MSERRRTTAFPRGESLAGESYSAEITAGLRVKSRANFRLRILRFRFPTHTFKLVLALCKYGEGDTDKLVVRQRHFNRGNFVAILKVIFL